MRAAARLRWRRARARTAALPAGWLRPGEGEQRGRGRAVSSCLCTCQRVESRRERLAARSRERTAAAVRRQRGGRRSSALAALVCARRLQSAVLQGRALGRCRCLVSAAVRALHRLIAAAELVRLATRAAPRRAALQPLPGLALPFVPLARPPHAGERTNPSSSGHSGTLVNAADGRRGPCAWLFALHGGSVVTWNWPHFHVSIRRSATDDLRAERPRLYDRGATAALLRTHCLRVIRGAPAPAPGDEQERHKVC
jgi:hypothetical protein